MRKIKVLIIFGTRPEAIKMAPLCIAMGKDARFEARICLSGQHREMLDQMLEIFNIKGHYDLNVMRQGQDLTELSSKILEGLQPIIKNFRPDICLVHGDTTTSMAASLSSFYLKTPIGHVEAGLRTNNLFSPWPEEGNRRINSVLSTLHFAPSEDSVSNLLAEGVNQKSIILTGNTVIDALNIAVDRLRSDPILAEELSKQFCFLSNNRKMLLVTGHRRENIGIALDGVSRALAIIAKKYPDIDIVYAMHMNPAVHVSVKKHLGSFNNVHLIGPQDYMAFIYLMKQSTLILTDSGGIQEEAPALGKPVLVFRETTERPEAVRAGCAKLIGVEDGAILMEVERLITNESERILMSQIRNPYGDGLASGRIIDSLVRYFKETAATSK